jgi:hypothetical protein
VLPKIKPKNATAIEAQAIQNIRYDEILDLAKNVIEPQMHTETNATQTRTYPKTGGAIIIL